MADLGSTNIGGSEVRGGAEKWPLPPVYKTEEEEADHAVA